MEFNIVGKYFLFVLRRKEKVSLITAWTGSLSLPIAWYPRHALVYHSKIKLYGLVLAAKIKMKRILVVDDDKDILNILKLVLNMNGFEVMVTPNGEEALAKSVSYSPQLVLMDVFLSGTDGRDICNILKNNPRTKDIPVVMFSAHSNMQDILQVCNAADFIAKPFDIAALVEKINLHLEV